MNQLLIFVLLLTLLAALYITPGQTTGEEFETTDPWSSAETSAS